MHAILTAQSSPALIADLELLPAPMWTWIDENRLNVLEQALAADERLTRGAPF